MEKHPMLDELKSLIIQGNETIAEVKAKNAALVARLADIETKAERPGRPAGTCTRAEENLALVLFSEAPEVIRKFMISNGWMAEDEIVVAATDGTYKQAALQR
jgi:hypothetical protein